MANRYPVALLKFCPFCGTPAPDHIGNGRMECAGCKAIYQVCYPSAMQRHIPGLPQVKIIGALDDVVSRSLDDGS